MKRTSKKTNQSQVSNVDSVFSRILITKKISVPIKNINHNIHNIIKDIIISTIEGKCIVEGYVKPGSVNIITFSCGLLQGHNVSYEVVVQCEVCCPVDGMTFNCITTDTNKAGILAKMNNTQFNPITVFVARDHNFNSHIFSIVKTGDVIMVRVIGQRFELNDENIWVIAEIVSIVTKNEPELSTVRDTTTPITPITPIKSVENDPHPRHTIQKLPNFINYLKGQESNIYNTTLERIGFFKTNTATTSNISIGKPPDISLQSQSQSTYHTHPLLAYDLSSYLLNGNEIISSIMLNRSATHFGNALLCNGRKFHIQSKMVIYTRGGVVRVYTIPTHNVILTNSNNKNISKDKSSQTTTANVNEFTWPLHSNLNKVDCDIKGVIADRITLSLNKLLTDVGSEFSKAIPPINSFAAYELFTLDIMVDDEGNASLFAIKDLYTENNTRIHLSDNESMYIINNIICYHFGIACISLSSNPMSIGHNTTGTLIKHNALLHTEFKLVPLEDTIQITQINIDELAEIGSDPYIYNKLGVGSRKWDVDVLSKLQKNAIKDSTTLHRQYYHWIVLFNGNAIGYVGIRPDDTSSSISQLRYFISQDEKYKRKGFMFSAIALALEYHASIMFPVNPEIRAIIALNNLPSRGLIIKLGFEKTGTKIIKDIELDVYSRLARKIQ